MLRICNTYCFSTAAVVTRTRLVVPFRYASVACLVRFHFVLKSPQFYEQIVQQFLIGRSVYDIQSIAKLILKWGTAHATVTYRISLRQYLTRAGPSGRAV